MSEKTSAEIAKERAAELSKELNTIVHPLVFKGEDGEDIIGYFREPNRMQKIAIMDKSIMGSFSASAELYEILLLKEHSDHRLYSDRPEHDKYYMGGAMEVNNSIKFSLNQAAAAKKN